MQEHNYITRCSIAYYIDKSRIRFCTIGHS